jgi:hypothetical protein
MVSRSMDTFASLRAVFGTLPDDAYAGVGSDHSRGLDFSANSGSILGVNQQLARISSRRSRVFTTSISKVSDRTTP